MRINILGITKPIFEMGEPDFANFISDEYKLNSDTNNQGDIAKLQDLITNYCGIIGGECYSSDGMATLTTQPKEKAINRANNCAKGGHLSVFGHFVATLELVDIPKALCMLLNNNHVNNTSERSMRYTNMSKSCNERDLILYEKWNKIFYEKTEKTYGEKYPQIFSKTVITKRANENARYIISSNYKTNMVYTNDIREFTYISNCIDNIIAQGEDKLPFFKNMEKELIEFNKLLKETGLVFDCFNNQLPKNFSLLSKNNKVITPYYGDCIADTYKMSLAGVAQLQRHRFLNISIAFDKKPSFFIPPIIKDDKNLVKEWLKDCESQAEFIPEALLVNVNEIVPTFLITKKYFERLCNSAQLEICSSCIKQIKRILKNLDTNVSGVKEELQKINASRCTWQENFKCPTPCGFIEGVKCTRKI